MLPCVRVCLSLCLNRLIALLLSSSHSLYFPTPPLSFFTSHCLTASLASLPHFLPNTHHITSHTPHYLTHNLPHTHYITSHTQPSSHTTLPHTSFPLSPLPLSDKHTASVVTLFSFLAKGSGLDLILFQHLMLEENLKLCRQSCSRD